MPRRLTKCDEHAHSRGPAPKGCLACHAKLTGKPVPGEDRKWLPEYEPTTGAQKFHVSLRDRLFQIHECAYLNPLDTWEQVAQKCGVSKNYVFELKRLHPEEWEVARREAAAEVYSGHMTRLATAALVQAWQKGNPVNAADVLRSASVLQQNDTALPVKFTLNIPRATSADAPVNGDS